MPRSSSDICLGELRIDEKLLSFASLEEEGPLLVVAEEGSMFFFIACTGGTSVSSLFDEASAISPLSSLLRSGEDGTLLVFLASSSSSLDERTPSLDASLFFLLETYGESIEDQQQKLNPIDKLHNQRM